MKGTTTFPGLEEFSQALAAGNIGVAQRQRKATLPSGGRRDRARPAETTKHRGRLTAQD